MDEKIVLLDVREPEELLYEGKIEEAVNIPLGELPARFSEYVFVF